MGTNYVKRKRIAWIYNDARFVSGRNIAANLDRSSEVHMSEMDAWIPPLRMEEEEESEPRRIGFGSYQEQENDSSRHERIEPFLSMVLRERDRILSDSKLSTKDKLKLLEANHRTLLVMRGGRIKTFKTEFVVYGILAFSTVIILSLAVLNVKAKLPPEITLTFLGTTLGG